MKDRHKTKRVLFIALGIPAALLLLNLSAAPYEAPTIIAGTAREHAAGNAAPGRQVEWRDEFHGCRLLAKVARNTFSAGDPIVVEVEVQNAGNEELQTNDENEPWFVRGEDQTGLETRSTQYSLYLHGQLPYASSGSVRYTPLQPRHCLVRYLPLNRFWDATQGGNYKIRIGYLMAIKGEACILQSDPLDITIADHFGPAVDIESDSQMYMLQVALAKRNADYVPYLWVPGPELASLRSSERVETITRIGNSLQSALLFLREAGRDDGDLHVQARAQEIMVGVEAKADKALSELRGTPEHQ